MYQKIQSLGGFFLPKKELFMKTGTISLLFFLISLLPAGPVSAHFGMVIPSDSMVMGIENKTVNLKLSFSHPMEMIGMELAKPKAFSVMINGKKQDLLGTLEKTLIMGRTAWKSDFKVKRPGVYMFYMEPTPYWEPAEDIYIIHYTKTVMAAFGDDEGWDQELGLKTEIVPLSKPFGLYDGIFTYAAPQSGWWGFAALNQADFKLKHAGVEKDVEIGAVIWVKFHEFK